MNWKLGFEEKKRRLRTTPRSPVFDDVASDLHKPRRPPLLVPNHARLDSRPVVNILPLLAPFLTPMSVRAHSWALRLHLWWLLLPEEDGFLCDSLVDGELQMQPMVTEFGGASETFTEAITKTTSCVCKKVLYVMLTPKRRRAVRFWFFFFCKTVVWFF